MYDRDIERAAHLMLQKHGPYATQAAERRAQDLLDEGSTNGHQIWKQVAEAIRQMQKS